MRTRFGMKIVGCLSFLVLAVILTACSGGGGGGSGGGGGGELAYSGVRTQAVILEYNAVHLAVMAFQGSYGMSGVVGREAASQRRPEPKVFLGLFKLARSVREKIPAHGGRARDIATESQTYDGDCGGQEVYAYTLNDKTGEFSGTIEYKSYCIGGTTYSGRVRISGWYDLYWDELVDYTVSLDNLRMSWDDAALTMHGDIGYDFDIENNSEAMTMDFLLEDHGADLVFWINDFHFNFTDSGDYFVMTMAGRFYDPESGYVDVSTLTPFRSNWGSDNPYQGVLLLAGANNTKAQLVFLSETAYGVIADISGDGIYELMSGGLGGVWGDEEAISYTGMTSQAAITADNAERLAVRAFSGIFGAGIISAEGKSYIENTVYHDLMGLVRNVKETIPWWSVSTGPVKAGTGTYEGPCGGEVAYTVIVDESVFSCYGSLNFREYCIGRVTFNGEVQFWGSLDPDWQVADDLDLYFNNVAMTFNGERFTILGEVVPNYGNFALNLLLKDGGVDVASWFDNLQLYVDQWNGLEIWNIDHCYYDSEYGYVDVKVGAFTHLKVDLETGAVESGTLELYGANNTKALLSILSATSYRVTADTDGDGTYDWDSGVLEWK